MLELTTSSTGKTVSSEQGRPIISIVTATYNASDQLPGLIEGLRTQSDRNFEWIVVDGVSPDSTTTLLSASGDIVSKWISEPDFGVYDALNKAIRLCSGEYYLVLGADDRLFPDAIAQFKQHALATRADIVTAGINIDGAVTFGKSGRSWLHGMFAYVSGHSVGTLIRRNLHDRFGEYSRRFPVAADMYFLKTVCKSPITILHRANFVAGEHGTYGVSSQDKAATFCDCFRVQLETEPRKVLQVLLFIAKLIWRMSDLIAGPDRLGKQPLKSTGK